MFNFIKTLLKTSWAVCINDWDQRRSPTFHRDRPATTTITSQSGDTRLYQGAFYVLPSAMAVAFVVDRPRLNDLAINRRQILTALVRSMKEGLIWISDRNLTQISKSCSTTRICTNSTKRDDTVKIHQDPVIGDTSTRWCFSTWSSLTCLSSSRGCFSPSGPPGDKQVLHAIWTSYHSISEILMSYPNLTNRESSIPDY
jgi:hypothetical protein